MRIDLRTDDGVAPAYEYGAGPPVLFLHDGIGMRAAMPRWPSASPRPASAC